MKQLLLALLLGTSLIVIADAAPAYAQSTEQTDQSEEDWRKSRKKRDTQDIFDDILNPRNTGSGTGYGPPNPIESLPEESRRHLMKERAKVIATSNPGQTPNTPYNPSEAAKSDPDLQEQEKEAWEEIVKDLKGGGQGSGQPDDGNRPGGQSGQQGDPNKVADAGQRGSQGGQTGQPSQNGQSGSSGYQGPVRGGSSASVSDILAKIKGLQPSSGYGGGSGTQPGQSGNGQGTTPGGLGQSPTGPLGTGGAGSQGQAGQGQASQGQGSQGQGSQGQGSQGQSQQGQGQQPAIGQQQSQSQQAGQSQQQGQQSADGQSDSAQQASSQAQAQSQSQADGQSQSDAQQAQAQAQADAQAQAAAEAHARAHTDPIGPLNRIKRSRAETTGSGRRTSASDFLKDKD